MYVCIRVCECICRDGLYMIVTYNFRYTYVCIHTCVHTYIYTHTDVEDGERERERERSTHICSNRITDIHIQIPM